MNVFLFRTATVVLLAMVVLLITLSMQRRQQVRSQLERKVLAHLLAPVVLQAAALVQVPRLALA